MDFVDTHCHIQSSDKQLANGSGEAVTRKLWEKAGFPSGDELITRAVEVNVTRMICVGCSLPDSELAVDFVASHPECWASIGIHPHEAKDYIQDNGLDTLLLERFAALATAPRVVAVGECGLDYYYEHSEPADQAQMLRFQIELALEHNLPMIFHVRGAFDDFWPIFDTYTGIRGVLHSYTDNQANLERAVEKGLYVGVNGIATFSKSPELRDIYKAVPLSRLLLETDAPFLTPSPWRGRVCEPYHISVTAEFLAGLRNEPLQQLADVTTMNAQQLFNL